MSKRLIAAIGKVNRKDFSYSLNVENLPSVEHAEKFAQIMGLKIVQALQEIMGDPENVSVNANVSEEMRSKIGESVGKEAMKAPTLEDFLEKIGAPPEVIKQVSEAVASIGNEVDDCQCPGCVARRAAEARERDIEAGSKSDAKH